MSDTCGSCRRPILWARTPAGKPTPLDPEPSVAGNVRLYQSRGELTAHTLSMAVRDAAIDDGEQLYVEHGASCVDASMRRRRERRRG